MAGVRLNGVNGHNGHTLSNGSAKGDNFLPDVSDSIPDDSGFFGNDRAQN